jgi:hypothetical protein
MKDCRTASAVQTDAKEGASSFVELAKGTTAWRTGGTGHDVHSHAALHRADEALDDDHVLEAFVLQEQRVPPLINESANPFSSTGRAPDQMALV